tara:strand:- start:84 stop:287 length:204 start_codon:yes stop_codon:yes gene_type:complete
MTLDQIAKKHGINSNSLNAKDDGLKIAVKSIQQLIPILEKRKTDPQTINDIKKLGEFLFDVSDSSLT